MSMLKRLFGWVLNERGNFGGSSKEKKSAETGIKAAGEQAYQRGAMTGQESQQYGGSFGMGQDLQSLLMQYLGLGPQTGMTPEQQYQNQGPLAQSLYGYAQGQAQDPYAGWQSSLQPQLQLAQQNIDQTYNQRGLMQSGMPIEAMGRAGLELAVAQAQNRMAYGQQAIQNAQGIQGQAAGVGQQNISNLGSLYGQQQQGGLQAMGRQAGQAQAAGQYQAAPFTAQLGNYYGQQASAQAIPGQLIGAAGNFLSGGIPGMGGTGQQYQYGGQNYNVQPPPAYTSIYRP